MLAVFIAAHVYLYRRLLRDTGVPAPLLKIARALGIVLLVGLAAGRAFSLAPRPLTIAMSAWLGIFLYLLIARLALAPLSRLAKHNPERRLFLQRGLAAGTAIIATPAVAIGMFAAYEPPNITEVPIRLPLLPKNADGFSLVQLSDIHIGPVLRREFVRDLVARTNALKPEAIVITGDLVDGEPEDIGEHVAEFAKLLAPHGVYFVTGNHDYYSGVTDWVAFIEKLGIQVLRNRWVALPDFDLIGVDDWGNRRTGRRDYDLDQAIVGRSPERASVLLAHQPENLEAVSAAGIGLQLSGHTHGGQTFPSTLIARAIWGEQTAGYSRFGNTQIYTSRGCGFVGPSLRLGSHSEIVRLTLNCS